MGTSVVYRSVTSMTTAVVSSLYASMSNEAMMGGRLEFSTAVAMGNVVSATLTWETTRRSTFSSRLSQTTVCVLAFCPPYPMSVWVRAMRVTWSISTPSISMGIS